MEYVTKYPKTVSLGDDGDGDNLYSYYYLFSSKGTAASVALDNSYVSDCEIIGNLKLEKL